MSGSLSSHDDDPNTYNQSKEHITMNENQQTLISLYPPNKKKETIDDVAQKKKQTTTVSKNQQLRQWLRIRTQTIDRLKKHISFSKAQMEKINSTLDSQWNRTMSKKKNQIPAKINLLQKFRLKNKPMQEQLSKIANYKKDIKRIKQEAQTPLNVMQQSWFKEIEQKNKELGMVICTKLATKNILKRQIERMTEVYSVRDDDSNEQQIVKIRKQLINLNHEIQEQKSSDNNIEHQDRVITEKTIFLKEQLVKINKYKNNRRNNNFHKLQEKEKKEIEQKINQIVKQIQEIFNQRDAKEIQLKNQLNSKMGQIRQVQSKNREICNTLRNIDSHMLKYYNLKSKKKSHKKSSNDLIEVKRFTDEHSFNFISQHKEKNDKNITQIEIETILVQKRKNYDFGGFKQFSIALSDEFMGNQNYLHQLSFTVDDYTLYGMQATYLTPQHECLKGYNICPKIMPKSVRKIELILNYNKMEMINFVRIGQDKQGRVKFINIGTTQQIQIKWGSIEGLAKYQQKNIRWADQKLTE